MATTITCSIGARSADNVTVNSVSGSDPGPYTVTLSAPVPSTTKIGDTLTDSGSRVYLIEGISGSDLTVYKRHLGAGADPATGAGTTQRAYALPHSWADAAPSDLTTADQVWRGECWNDAAFTVSSSVNLDSTSDDTRYMILTTATGQSFKDHADKLTNALRPNQSNGVLFNLNNDIAVHAAAQNAQIENIQFVQTGGSNPITAAASGNATTFGTHRNCIFKSTRGGSVTDGVVQGVRKNYVNCAIIAGTSGMFGMNNSGSTSGKISSCTFINTAGSGRGISSIGVVDNTAVFGFSGSDNDVGAGSNNNATDRADFATNSSSDQESLTAADQIESLTGGSEDLRAKSTGALKDNGVRDQTYTNDLDIVGQTRSTTTPTIGAWEVVAAVGHPSTRRLGGIRHGRPGGMPGVNVFKDRFAFDAKRRIFLPSWNPAAA